MTTNATNIDFKSIENKAKLWQFMYDNKIFNLTITI